MFSRIALALLCLAIPCTAYSQVQIIQGPNGPQIVPQQQVYPQRPAWPNATPGPGWPQTQPQIQPQIQPQRQGLITIEFKAVG